MAAAGSVSLAAPPKVTTVFPPGAARGASVIVTAAGDFPSWPLKIWSDQQGLTWVAEKDKGKFKVTVAADATPGVAWIRAYGDEGPSAPRPFIIGAIPEVDDTEPNDVPDKSQRVTLPVTINGRLAKSGDVDSFAFELKAGQTVVAALTANQVLGAPMDGVLQICRLREPGVDGIAVERTETVVLEHNDDARGLDPQASFTASKDGRYVVRIFAFPAEAGSGIAFSGADNFVYRLTITVGGFLDHPLPMALARGQAVELQLRGWNLAGPSAKATWSGNSGEDLAWGVFHPEATGAWKLPIVDYPSLSAEAGATVDRPQSLVIPCVVSGEIGSTRESHAFRFAAKKGARVRLQVESRSLGFPLDAVLSILDSSGKVAAEADDSTRNDRDPVIAFNPPADGEYRAVVRDLHHRGGLRFAYRLTIAPIVADFSIDAGESHLLAAGKTLELAVTLNRQENYAEPIVLRVEGLPEGVTAEEVPSSTGASAKGVKLVVKAKEGLPPWQGPIRIIGESKGSKGLKRYASYSLSGSSERLTTVWLTITK
jgi:hypothetical protein